MRPESCAATWQYADATALHVHLDFGKVRGKGIDEMRRTPSRGLGRANDIPRQAGMAARSRRRCGASTLINWPAMRMAGAWSRAAARSTRWRLASSAASLTAAPQVIVVLDPAVMGAGG